MSDYIKKSDVRHLLLRNDREAALAKLEELEAVDAVPVVHGEWVEEGKQMVINLENAREQYSALGYPHRTILKLWCSNCHKLTFVDSSIAYNYCPNCVARMDGERKDGAE